MTIYKYEMSLPVLTETDLKVEKVLPAYPWKGIRIDTDLQMLPETFFD